ncbi:MULTISPECIES: DUF3558 domain-containing protein [Amycolatopsis]|uniref:DUF3558 domain-containing protein n=1 Tax=Amycolatopsis thermalba TaxID=944492 RepID=A0ABY4NMM3_9PSEU|nr:MULTISPECIES: DUF3558 domain-containing protein [Amycolatopsis]OXM74644.1 hypothetical protein CF166_03730 [Amycolatopsis sp. KNN50.9b]UQS21657.1 DUF3558 domain-containing protein [Amycolatopsis thermalba]
MKRSAALVAAVVVTTGLTACSTTVSGRPTPAPRTTSEAPTPLDALNACTLLDQLLAGQGFTPGQRIGVRNECGATKPGYGSVSIALDPERADPPGTPFDVNGRKALIGQFTGPGTCEVVLVVTEHARASATVVLLSGDLQDEACAAAEDLATSLEPLLPR